MSAPSAVAGNENAKTDPESSFPNEIYLETMRILSHRRWNQSLLEMMLSNREVLVLGLPLLLRELKFKHPFDPYDAQTSS
jgi:hypothetical protein